MAENKMEQVDFWIRFFQEHINTIGCVELDGLDCREVLALLQELADRKADKQNKMEAVAKLFGKRLGEEFTVKDKYKTEWHCKFTKKGLMYLNKNFFDWQESGDYLLQFLLTGQAVIIND